jgi:hypothetical protein
MSQAMASENVVEYFYFCGSPDSGQQLLSVVVVDCGGGGGGGGGGGAAAAAAAVAVAVAVAVVKTWEADQNRMVRSHRLLSLVLVAKNNTQRQWTERSSHELDECFAFDDELTSCN